MKLIEGNVHPTARTCKSPRGHRLHTLQFPHSMQGSFSAAGLISPNTKWLLIFHDTKRASFPFHLPSLLNSPPSALGDHGPAVDVGEIWIMSPKELNEVEKRKNLVKF